MCERNMKVRIPGHEETSVLGADLAGNLVKSHRLILGKKPWMQVVMCFGSLQSSCHWLRPSNAAV